MLYLVIAIHLILPALSVLIYEKLQGSAVNIRKRIMLYFAFAFSSFFTLYALTWLREMMYHEWLLRDLTVAGVFRRMVMPVGMAGVLPFALYFYRKLADRFLKDDEFDDKIILQFAHFSLSLYSILLIMFVSVPLLIATSANVIIEAGTLTRVMFLIIGISLFFGAVVFLLKWRYRYIETVITAALVICFVNAFIFPFDVGIMDGVDRLQGIGDNIFPLVRNILVFAVLMGLMIMFRKQLRFLLVPIFAFALVLTVINFSTMHNMRESRSTADEYAIQSVATFSSERNIVVIVMDMLQGTLAERVFREYPEFMDSFSGFTMFSRAFTSFPFTQYSKNVIQSGVLYTSDDILWRESNLKSHEDSFMMDMQNEGFDVNLFGTIFEDYRQELFPYVARVEKHRMWSVYTTVSSAALARIFGFWFRSPVAEALSYRHIAEEREEVYPCVANTEMLIEKATVTDEGERLLYFWNLSPHIYVNLFRDGSIDHDTVYKSTERQFLDETFFIFSQLSRLFERMKELDVYDNSLIIIVSDHGTVFSPEIWLEHGVHMPDFTIGEMRHGNFRAMSFYNAVMMVKPPGADGSATITHDAAWNGDVRELVNRYNSNFTAMPPIEVMAEIRAANPVVGVMFAPYYVVTILDVANSTEHHQILYATSLFDIPQVFTEHTGVVEW